ncbi:hypothetical protein EMCRGX_G034634 [Ephydatia muelleri]
MAYLQRFLRLSSVAPVRRAAYINRVVVASYHEKVIDHYENPRNVGAFDKNDMNVGTGLVGAPACGDVMKLQVSPKRLIRNTYYSALPLHLVTPVPCYRRGHTINPLAQPQQIRVDENGKIIDAKFKTFGCGSAIASSSLATEWVKGKSLDEAATIKNSQIANELSLPPVKLHCSMLAEDAIKAALKDYKTKREKANQTTAPPQEKAVA